MSAPTRLRRAPRWILALLTTLVVCVMLAVNSLASAEIVSETGAGETGAPAACHDHRQGWPGDRRAGAGVSRSCRPRPSR